MSLEKDRQKRDRTNLVLEEVTGRYFEGLIENCEG